ncbi:MAG TPA: acyl-CoA dehydrogenase family protein [Dehalococcoidia bacterium]|nr:acyl-CoA dehydrogenase family protein [Dehalococcoidia bacterium]
MRSDSPTASEALLAAHRLASEVEAMAAAAVARAAELTQQGNRIDDHQVMCERLALLATEARAARALVGYAERLVQSGRADAVTDDQAFAYAAEVAQKLIATRDAHPEDFADLGPADEEVRALIRRGLDDARIRNIGTSVIEARGANNVELDNDDATQTRMFARQFAKQEILREEDGEAIADRVHRQDLLVPESWIKQFSELGFFGSSVPDEYGGTEMGYLTMIVLTEELSQASLIAGSLLTRSEILTRALLEGGTEAQKRHWLPKLASGEVLVGISVTEPDVGSDVANVQCKATPGERDGKKGWLINGAKAWCTFAGRANVLALLARTDPDASKGYAGLSLFIVPKETFDGHKFEYRQPEGGLLSGEAIPTPGYRGMHSYILNLEDYFVPAENLVGEEQGQGRGFYLTLGGFAIGRLQTGGRALGVAQAALEKACAYTTQRVQFGRPISEYQLTRYKIGLMATRIAAARQLTYDVARTTDPRARAPLGPAMAKLFASDVAVWATQEAQLLHGGWGYAEEDRISRYVVDAQVLPIFEGVKATLELKVIARALTAGG